MSPPRPDSPAVTVVDYGAGNLRSVTRALDAVGVPHSTTHEARAIADARAVILPGVGSAKDAMEALHRLDLVQPLRDFVSAGRPFLGVCVGLQLLFNWSEEGGGVECLGILPGQVIRFEPERPDLKVPHMGWNTVRFMRDHPLLDGIPDNSFFYFVHSYYARPDSSSVTLGLTDYGHDFTALVAHENVAGAQFHPEKSADAGLRLYSNFAGQMDREPLLAAHTRD